MPAAFDMRYATAADVPALAAMAADAFRDTYRELSDAADIEDYVGRHFTVAAVAAVVGAKDAPVLLVLDGEAIVGYAMLRRAETPPCVAGPHPIRLARIYLAQRVVGQGLGAELLDAVHAEARRLGGETLWLSVYDRNVRAVHFYETHGLVHVGGEEFEFGGEIYIDPVYAGPVDLAAARRADEKAIERIVHAFFGAFTSAHGAVANVQRVYDLTIPGAVVVKAMGEAPDVYTLREFVEPRAALLASGTLVEFEEAETASHTTIAGHIAQRTASYRKSGVHDGVPFEATGVKMFQFVRMREGWRISAVAWDDDAELPAS